MNWGLGSVQLTPKRSKKLLRPVIVHLTRGPPKRRELGSVQLPPKTETIDLG